MAQATEIVPLPLKAGAKWNDESDDAGKAWRETLNILARQDGFLAAYYNTEVENPTSLRLLVEWKTLEHHKAFIASPEYGPFGQRLMTLLDRVPSFFHVKFTSALAPVAQAPVTENLSLYFPAGYDEAAFEPVWQRFREVTEKEAEGYVGSASGWSYEEVEHEGELRRVFYAVVGWRSLEAHRKYRETEAFKGAIGPVRELVKGSGVVHVSYVKDVQVPGA